MTNYHTTKLALLIASILLCFNHIVLAANQPIWIGESGGLNIRWTEEDITATESEVMFSAKQKEGEVVFSAKQKKGKVVFSAKKDLSYYLSEEQKCKTGKRTMTILSVVGSIASIKDTPKFHCKNDDQGFPRFTTVDLAKSGKVVSLTDLFPESDILKALLAVPAIEDALAESEITKAPATLKEFIEKLDFGLTRSIPVAREDIDNSKNCLWLSEDDDDGDDNDEGCHFYLDAKHFLSQFAFHHIEDDKVVLHLGLLPAEPTCQWCHAQISIYLPIPTTLQPALFEAKEGKAGFLMNNMKGGGRETTINSR